MYCRSCGKEIKDDALFCQFCGCEVGEVVVKSAGDVNVTWRVFARIAKIVGIVSLATSPIFGGFEAIPGIVFAKLAMKSTDQAVYDEAKVALRNNVIALVISSVLLTLYFTVWTVLMIVAASRGAI